MNTTFGADYAICRIKENGYPLVYSILSQCPDASIQRVCQWLTVISLEYKCQDRNRMPGDLDLRKIEKLDLALDAGFDESPSVIEGYRRTGNGLREWVYYSRDQSEFSQLLNQCLASHSPYPIEIKFYQDPVWEDLKELQEEFKLA